MSLRNNFFDSIYERLLTQLPSHLTYHNSHHTNYVVEKALFLAEEEQITKYDRDLLVVAALYHDIGYLTGREEHELLYDEITFFEPELDESSWTELQHEFLTSHSYHTNYGKIILEPVKQRNLAELKVMG